MIQFDQEEKDLTSVACIKVIGVGGAGGNTINRMIESGFQGADFYAINTDAQALKTSLAGKKIQIGLKSTKGLGAGANPEAGKRAAEEDLDKVMQELSGADIVFVTGGMGGGTGSGAIPVIVQALKEKGILSIVVVTKPFLFEGKRRARITEQALESIKAVADTLLIIPNQKLLDVADETVSMIDGFGMINEVLNQSVRGISEIITRPGHINVDFADVREIMKDKGLAVMGSARASGPGRAKKAALEAISSPLLETMSIAGARAVLLNITGGVDLGLHEISEAASVIYEQADEDANIILGSVIDSTMGNEVLVTIIATGFISQPITQYKQPIPVTTYKAVEPVQPVYQAAPLYEQQAPTVHVASSFTKVSDDRPAQQSAPAIQAVVTPQIVAAPAPVVEQVIVQPVYVAPTDPIQEVKPVEVSQVIVVPAPVQESKTIEVSQVSVARMEVAQLQPVAVAPVSVVVPQVMVTPVQEVVMQQTPQATAPVQEAKAVEVVQVAVTSVMQVAEAPALQAAPVVSPFEAHQDVIEEGVACTLRQLAEEQEFQKMLEEEAALQAVKDEAQRLFAVALAKEEAVKPAEMVRHEESVVAQAKVEETAPVQVIDINDLDIPAFMRKQAKEKRSE